jgi:hypothetical protein
MITTAIEVTAACLAVNLAGAVLLCLLAQRTK